jgi:hypothetical protein
MFQFGTFFSEINIDISNSVKERCYISWCSKNAWGRIGRLSIVLRWDVLNIWKFCEYFAALSRNRKNCFLFAHFYSQWDIIKWPWKIYLSVSKSWNLINKWIHFSLSKKMCSVRNDFKMFISPHNGFSFVAYIIDMIDHLLASIGIGIAVDRNI